MGRVGSKAGLLWVAWHVERLIRKWDGLFQKRRRECPRDRRYFWEVKHLVWTGVGTAYSCCLRSVLGLSGEEGRVDTDSDRWRPAQRKLFSLVENAKQDSHGVSHLKDKDSGITVSKNKNRAALLDWQFRSVFSQLSPFKLSQLCMDGLRGYFSARIPGRFQCCYLKMLGVGIDLKGILKLLTNLKPNKAPGLDGVGPMVLKEIG